MKKFYVLLSVMVLALMTAGFSYAYWTDTLTVNGTANTGILDVDFAHVSMTNDVYVTEEHAIGDDLLTLTISDLYPGAQVIYVGKIVNNSTIPVKPGALTGGVTSDPNNLENALLFTVDYVNEASLPVDIETYVLDVDEELTFTITIQLPLGTEDNTTQDETVTAQWVLDYQQWNAS
ncbi:SipW-dependent-type signal peptide-containing protein [Mycoplasmatota bacterium WC44]